MYCPECGKKITNPAKFCWACGTRLPSVDPTAAAAGDAGPGQPTPAAQEEPQQSEASTMNRPQEKTTSGRRGEDVHSKTRTRPFRRVTADELREPGEKVALGWGLAVLSVGLLGLIGVSMGLVLVAIGLAIAFVKIRQGQLLGQSVRVTEQQLPEVFAAAQDAAARLSMPMPDVFVTQDPRINAFALGFLRKQSVVLNSATIEAMTPAELRAIIGHEFTHIKCEHTNWMVLTNATDTIRVPLISDVAGFVLLSWSRKAEYTCDRGGLIACQDLRAIISALAKVAVGGQLFKKMELDTFLDQKRQVDADDIARFSEMLSTHPYVVNRISRLHTLARNLGLADGHRVGRVQMLDEWTPTLCAACGADLPLDSTYCRKCGLTLAAPQLTPKPSCPLSSPSSHLDPRYPEELEKARKKPRIAPNEAGGTLGEVQPLPRRSSSRWGIRLSVLSTVIVLGVIAYSVFIQKSTQTPQSANSVSRLVLTERRGTDQAAMVRIPAGTFTMGDTHEDLDPIEKPPHPVTLTAFWLDKTEVTKAQFAHFVRATGYNQREEWQRGFADNDEHPVIYVNWHKAVAYCRWAGKRLPTEAEWEYAARGKDGRRYPWGNTWEHSRARYVGNMLGETTAPVGSYPAGASPFGVLDLAGNASEWTSSLLQPYPYSATDGRETKGVLDDDLRLRVFRGGSFSNYPKELLSTHRNFSGPSTRQDPVGFRCAQSAQ